MARLDVEMVIRGIVSSRTRAKEMINSRSVLINERMAKKASENILETDKITLLVNFTYVGRGALKLTKAIEVFELKLNGLKCIDIGASTGGFTELMLENGAEKVFAVDVGHGQLAESLRKDSRVQNMEGTDIRNITYEEIGGKADFIAVDVSFISIEKIIVKIYELLKDGGYAVILIKPQFEAGKKNIGKKGVVKNQKTHQNVLEKIDTIFRSIGFTPMAYTYSPIKGGNGNIEYLTKIKKSSENPSPCNFELLVSEAFSKL